MMKWKLIIPIMFLLTIGIAAAIEMCGSQVEINQTCSMITPELDCAGNYTIINATTGDGSAVGNGTMDLLHTSATGSTYQFNFTQGRGDYLVKLCDGTTREIKVKGDDTKMIAAMIGFVAALGFFIYLYYHFKSREYGEWMSVARFIFISMAYYMVMGIMRIGITLLEDYGKQSLAYLFNTFWIIMMYVYGFLFFVVMFLFGVKFVWSIVEKRRYGE